MSLFEMVFGCSHKHCSFPITARGAQRRSAAASVTGTYVVCLDCGKEFPYDWEEMKMVRNNVQRESDGLRVVPDRKVA
jgi:RNase P subunit RPR2